MNSSEYRKLIHVGMDVASVCNSAVEEQQRVGGGPLFKIFLTLCYYRLVQTVSHMHRHKLGWLKLHGPISKYFTTKVIT